MGPPRHSLLSHMNPLHLLKSYWLKIHLNITLPHTPRSPQVISSAQVSKLKVHVNYRSIAYYMSSPPPLSNVLLCTLLSTFFFLLALQPIVGLYFAAL